MRKITADIKYDYYEDLLLNPKEDVWLSGYHIKDKSEITLDINKPIGEKTGRCLIHLAATSEVVLRWLIKHGADIHIKDINGYSVLDYALDVEACIEVLNLLGFHMNLNVVDPNGFSPLQVAMIGKYRCDNEERVEVLMKHGANVNFESDHGTALDYAIVKGKEPGFIHLLVSSRMLDEHAIKALDKLSKKDLLRVFIGPRMKPGFYIEDSIYDEHITYLVNRFKDDINQIVLANGHYGNLVHLACNSPRLLKQLIAHGADLSAQDQDGRTVLHYAVMLGNAEVIDILQQHHTDPKIIDKYNMYPIHSFHNLKRINKDKVIDILRYLYNEDSPVNLNALFDKSTSSLFINNMLEKLPKYLPECIDILSLDLNVHDGRGYSPLMICSGIFFEGKLRDRVDSIKYLLEKGADIDYCTFKGTVIGVMVKANCFFKDILLLYLEEGTSKTLELADECGRTPLCDATTSVYFEDFFMLLLYHGAKIDCGGKYGTVLNYALLKNQPSERIELILKYITKDTLSIPTEKVRQDDSLFYSIFRPPYEKTIQTEEYALDIALRNNDPEVIDLLVSHGGKASKGAIEKWQTETAKKVLKINDSLNVITIGKK